jgi:hypothetical protein
MTKYYTQPDFMGGKKVLAKDVPNNYYSVYAEESLLGDVSELSVIKHDNDPCFTKKDIAKQFNSFPNKESARSALSAIKNILK